MSDAGDELSRNVSCRIFGWQMLDQQASCAQLAARAETRAVHGKSATLSSLAEGHSLLTVLSSYTPMGYMSI